MSFGTRLAAAIAATLALAGAPSAARAGVITKTATLPLTSTNFNTDGSNLSPITFQQFDTQNNALVLDSVNLSFHALIKNSFGMNFTRPSTITATVGTGDPTKPGPIITMYQPDGKTPLVSAAAPNTAQALTRSVTYGFNPGETLPQSFGSDQPVGSKYYLQPAITEASNTMKLTAPADLALFTGKGQVKLPVAAQAYSQFHTTSGNGGGWVSTYGTADATITYEYHSKVPAPEVVPEPSTVLVWSLGGFALVAAHRARRKA